MRFAVSLLTLLGVASIIGTVLKQNEPYANYVVQFGQFWFGLFEQLGLYDVYHSVWFLGILLFLVASTGLCIYRNAPLMLREIRAYREHATEVSLRSFKHREEYFTALPAEETGRRLQAYLAARGFRFRRELRGDGLLFAAKAGSYQRLGYIFTHVAIVIICIGGLMDGNVPFKVQELLGYKKIETRDIPQSQVPQESRLSVANLSFRANMTVPEGAQGDVAFLRMKDGYLVQELPFAIALEHFRIQHYATGQPKSFESDVVILDKELRQPLRRTISVNHPLIYKGIAIYQSDFQDGGSKLDFKVWPLLTAGSESGTLEGRVFREVAVGADKSAMTVELNDFRLFNVLNLTADGKGKPTNVGPSAIFKVRDSQGQAHEYMNYMQPMTLDGRSYYVSGMRGTQSEDYRYLRLPADDEGSLQGFMRLRAVMFDPELGPLVARRLSAKALQGEAVSGELRGKFESSVEQLLKTFAQGGFTRTAQSIEQAVPAAEREKAAQANLKILDSATLEAYSLSRERAGKPAAAPDENTQHFLRDSLNAMSDFFFYGAPFYLQLEQFEQHQASGFQLTRSPGKNLVYSGSVLLVLGIFAMIYIRERRVWLLVKPAQQRVLFAMASNRRTRDLDAEFAAYRAELQQLLQG
ncbi:MAG: cytochrome c biogenesis protein ResB [Nitrosomonadales bacterium]|nr:MAG: cytochrome c biogenesis protein ResB [Nitrosomonadales bacterium]